MYMILMRAPLYYITCYTAVRLRALSYLCSYIISILLLWYYAQVDQNLPQLCNTVFHLNDITMCGVWLKTRVNCSLMFFDVRFDDFIIVISIEDIIIIYCFDNNIITPICFIPMTMFLILFTSLICDYHRGLKYN